MISPVLPLFSCSLSLSLPLLVSTSLFLSLPLFPHPLSLATPSSLFIFPTLPSSFSLLPLPSRVWTLSSLSCYLSNLCYIPSHYLFIHYLYSLPLSLSAGQLWDASLEAKVVRLGRFLSVLLQRWVFVCVVSTGQNDRNTLQHIPVQNKTSTQPLRKSEQSLSVTRFTQVETISQEFAAVKGQNLF